MQSHNKLFCFRSKETVAKKAVKIEKASKFSFFFVDLLLCLEHYVLSLFIFSFCFPPGEKNGCFCC